MTSLFRCYHAQRQWMDEIVAVSAVQRRGVAPTLRPTTPRYVAVPTFNSGAIGRVDPNWVAIYVGLGMGLWTFGLFELVRWWLS